MQIDPIARKLVWERFERDQPAPGPALSDWCIALAEESGLSASQVRRIVTEGAAVMLEVINARAQTLAQQIAERMGANLVAAFDVLRQAYSATKRKVLLDKGGRPKLVDPSEGGPGYAPENMIYIDVPDWHARLSAVRTTVEIFGARAPQQIEVSSQSVVVNLSAKDALAELQRIRVDLPRLEEHFAAIAEADPDFTGAREAIEGSIIH